MVSLARRVAVLGLALGLIACGDDSDGGGSGSAGMKTGGASTAGTPTTGQTPGTNGGILAGASAAGQSGSAGETVAGGMNTTAGEAMAAGQADAAGTMVGGSTTGAAGTASPTPGGANGTPGGMVGGTPMGPMCGADDERCRVACTWIAQCADAAMMCEASIDDLADACTASCVAMPMAANFLCGVTSCDEGLELVTNTQADFVATCSGPVGGQVVGGMMAGGGMGDGMGGAMGGPAIAYTTPEVQALLSRVCAPCHTNNGQPPIVDTIEETFWVQSSQVELPFIHPGNRARSYIYHKVAGTHIQAGGGGSLMPPNAPLSALEVEGLGLWIDNLEGVPPLGGMDGGGGQPAPGGMVPLEPLTTETAQAELILGCGPCHTIQGRSPVVSNVQDLFNARSNQSDLPYIQPGNRDRSYLFHKIAGTHRAAGVGGRGDRMPPTLIPYSDEEVERIGVWIDSLQ